VYPNPAKEFIQLAGAPDQTWHMYDAGGRLVAEGTTRTSIEKIDTDTFHAGIYFLRIGEKYRSFLKNE
jgi:hypothetical protein